jgi:hypothetical protein
MSNNKNGAVYLAISRWWDRLSNIIDCVIKAVFDNNFKTGQINPLGKTPSGYTEIAMIEIFDKNIH